ncbi:type II toxin-antitoxin system VapB family antitoxin [Pelagibacterium xiamenense]|uniref:type II toxin-antitoxin system VapB family antitoxin n=1 Tax=Pelagibacterium xiamenense TaxID=2901140 RepID=UPI001E2E8B61|nr:type II toxin-antitoxin system VapB family antitoxin [Pelagibacterium xiamenense]MCD7058390.1 type II toxin-antitoxin system VapB family antitoxin [Pelagibacterium xiamenense]
MPLYIRDDEVDRLASELQLLTRAPTKTEAVRRALRQEITRARAAIPLRDRLARAKALVRAMGPTDPDFDMKAHIDAMWGET